jgi:murein DD-endopeptidase MepM/ murein hydrolase activator NlpD
MGLAIGWLHLRPQPRGIALALIAFTAAGCSADSARFNDDPGPGATGGIAAQPTFGRTPSGSWSWDGGTAITVARGDTVDAIARRHHVPATAIIQANNLAAANAIRPGQQLVVPRYGPSPKFVRSVMPPPKPVGLVPPESIPTSGGGVSVATGADGHVAVADNRPGKSQRSGNAPLKAAIVQRNRKPLPEQHPVKLAARTPLAAKPAEKPADVDTSMGSDATPSFHWPVRGQVIAGFGPKSDGQRNDGIDIAVPENTPIKAANDGVVIYSGNQLKSFGNLVLVRHSNDYVTAYAHAKEIRVKKGDPIKGGEIIGMSGQTGNVDTPQVHFEIRKGSTPVDPMRLLHGA